MPHEFPAWSASFAPGFCTVNNRADTAPEWSAGGFNELHKYLQTHVRLIPYTLPELLQMDRDQSGWAKDGPAIILARFKRSGVRTDDEVVYTTGLGLDVDEKHVPEDTLAFLLEGVSAIIYESARSTPESRRWRVFIEYARPFTPAEHEQAFRYWAGRIPGVGTASKNPSKLWYALQQAKDATKRILRRLEGTPFHLTELGMAVDRKAAVFDNIQPPVDDPATEGARNTQLARYAASVVGDCLDEEEFLQRLLLQNDLYLPPLAEKEVRGIWARTWSRRVKFGWTEQDVREVPTDAGSFWNFADVITRPAPQWLVRELIHRKGVALMFGESGCGKSALTMAIALALAGGADVLGDLRIARRGGALYFALEGSLRTRTAPYVLEGLVDASEVRMALEQSLTLTADPECADLLYLKEYLQAAKEVDPDLALLIVDTLARAGEVDENSAELGRVAEYMHQLAEEFDVAVIIVHHSGKDASKGARGHSSLRAAVDTEIRVEVERDAQEKVLRRWFTVSKQREAEQGLTREFELHITELGLDDDGEPITGIWTSVGGVPTRQAGPRVPQGKVQGVVFKALQWLLSKASGAPRANLPGVGWAVPSEALVAEAVSKLPEKRDERGRDRRREVVRRALTELSADLYIHFGDHDDDQYVGIIGFEEK